MMNSSIIQDAPAYTPEQIAAFKAEFYRDGYKHVPAVLSPQEVAALKQGIDRVEQCTDDAKRSVQAGSVPNELRQSVDQMHQQARQAQQECSSSQQQQGDQTRLRDVVNQLEQSADRAMQACRNAGNVDPQVQQAVQRAHQEASQLKKQVQMG